MRVGSLILALVALVILASSAFIVRADQTAILLQFGRIVKSSYEPGLHFKIPLLQQVQRFDKRILTLESPPERTLTSEKKDVNIDFFVKWRISDAARYYVSVGGDEAIAQSRVAPRIRDGLRTAVNSRTLTELVSGGRADMTQSLIVDANRAIEGLGIEVIDLRIKRIDLPEDGTVINSVYERMRSERKKVASQLRAEGEEVSRTIQADADRQVQVIKAEAYRDAEKTRGEGDATAAQTYAAAYGRDAEFYSFYRSLEAYRSSLTSPNGLIVLDPKNEFLRYLQESK